MVVKNYASGEIEIADGNGLACRLNRDQANRLVMHARMHTVREFVEELPKFLDVAAVREAVLKQFASLATPTDRWNFKEKFARLRTLTREATAGPTDQAIEKITL